MSAPAGPGLAVVAPADDGGPPAAAPAAATAVQAPAPSPPAMPATSSDGPSVAKRAEPEAGPSAVARLRAGRTTLALLRPPLRLPTLSGSLTVPAAPAAGDSNHLLLPAALALLSLVAASGGFLGLAFRLTRQPRPR